MSDILGFLDNAFIQGLLYGCAVLGLAMAFRIVKYPDLTADGSFLLGSCVCARWLSGGGNWPGAMVLAMVAGGVAGCVTSLLHSAFGVNRLLSGILTSMICYSVGFRILADRSNLPLPPEAGVTAWTERLDAAWAGSLGVRPATLILAAAICAVLLVLLVLLMKSDFGLVLRATGSNARVVESNGRHPAIYRCIGLSLANALVAFAGVLVTSRQGFADVNMGVGITIVLIAALVIGEQFMFSIRLDPARGMSTRFGAALIGSVLYFIFSLLIVRASVMGWIPLQARPTDLKMLSALLIIAIVALRSRGGQGRQEEVLPL